jgi:hypothetical protein
MAHWRRRGRGAIATSKKIKDIEVLRFSMESRGTDRGSYATIPSCIILWL